MTHGQNCNKEPHSGSGYLHDETYDSPFDVDRVLYCGRCHMAMPVATDGVRSYEQLVRTSVFLTPDDIITLRLLRNAIANNLSREAGWKYLPEPMSHLETLERILKQVG